MSRSLRKRREENTVTTVSRNGKLKSSAHAAPTSSLAHVPRGALEKAMVTKSFGLASQAVVDLQTLGMMQFDSEHCAHHLHNRKDTTPKEQLRDLVPCMPFRLLQIL